MPSSDTNSKPKTVCILSVQAPFIWGGAEAIIDTLYEEFTTRGFETEIVNIPYKWYPSEVILKQPLPWRILDLREIGGKKIDIVIPTKFPSWAIKHPNKVTWLIHQMRQVYDFYGTEWNEFNQSVTDQVTRHSVMKLDEITIPESKKLYTISKNVSGRLKRYNGIESIPLYPPPRNNDAYHNDGYGEHVIYTGRLVKLKRCQHLIEAFRYVKSDAKCIIIGIGEEEAALKKMVAQWKLQDKVTFTGFIQHGPELLDYYAKCLAVYYAPVDEDYGLTTVEAFKSEKPVLTMHDSGGTLEFVEHGVNGFVTGVEPEKIAEHIDWLYNNRTKCAEFGKDGLSRVKDITWDKVIDTLTS